MKINWNPLQKGLHKIKKVNNGEIEKKKETQLWGISKNRLCGNLKQKKIRLEEN